MKWITHPREIAWFDLKNYDLLLDITLGELISQVEYRSSYWGETDYADDSWDENAVIRFITEGLIILEYGSLIKSYGDDEEHIQAMDEDSSLTIFTKEKRLARSSSIAPINVSTLMVADSAARKMELYKNDNNGDSLIETKHMLSCISLFDVPFLSNKIWANIYLNDYTDEQILSDLKALLPKWREETGWYGPKKPEWRVGEGSFVKLISHRVIPLMDLMIWERHSGVRIKDAVLAHILSGNEIKGEEQIRKTLKGFLRVASSNAYHEELRYVLKANPEIADRTVRSHIEIYGMSK